MQINAFDVLLKIRYTPQLAKYWESGKFCLLVGHPKTQQFSALGELCPLIPTKAYVSGPFSAPHQLWTRETLILIPNLDAQSNSWHLIELLTVTDALNVAQVLSG